MGWAAFGSQERAVWVRTLENGVWAAASHPVLLGESCCRDQGSWGQGQGKGLNPCSWKSQEHLGSAPFTELFAMRNVEQCDAPSVPEPPHRAPLLEGCEWSSPKKHPEVLTRFSTSFTNMHLCFAFKLLSGA